MTYEQLLPIYQRATGKPGQDDDFNKWVQTLVGASGSQTGVEGIPDGFVSAQDPKANGFIPPGYVPPVDPTTINNTGGGSTTGGAGTLTNLIIHRPCRGFLVLWHAINFFTQKMIMSIGN